MSSLRSHRTQGLQLPSAAEFKAHGIDNHQRRREAPESMAQDTTDEHEETGMVIFEDSTGMERPGCAMVDPSTSTLLLGYGPFKRYVSYLKSLGFDEDPLIFHKVDRTFHFGGDSKTCCRWSMKLPIYMNNQVGYIQATSSKARPHFFLGDPSQKHWAFASTSLNKA